MSQATKTKTTKSKPVTKAKAKPSTAKAKTKTKAKTKPTAKKKATKSTTAKAKTATVTRPPESKCNGYRKGSNYALAFDVVMSMGKTRPVKRSTMIERYAELSGKELKNAKFDMVVVLSPHQLSDGTFKIHRSATSAHNKFPYFIKRLEDGLVMIETSEQA